MTDNKTIAQWYKRLINFIIDTFIIGLLLSWPYLLYFIHGQKYVLFGCFLIYFLYYFCMEFFTGQTVGQRITGTIPLTNKLKKPSFFRSFIRSVVRLFWVEIISFNGARPVSWHDQVSGTRMFIQSKTKSPDKPGLNK
ncbi:MAG: RDD family protein [Fimbriimonadaceae bacterium]|nr:RDD family protein [Chitinophagales bacterium]